MRAMHVFFSGTVQGVGFRYTAQRVAQGFPVTGWVRNRSDGRVELLAQGSDAAVNDYLAALEKQMSGYIDGVVKEWEESTTSHDSFAILPTL